MGCCPPASTPPPTCRPRFASPSAGWVSRTPRWTAPSWWATTAGRGRSRCTGWCGSIAAAVDDGFVLGGVMYECVKREIPFVLGGSLRDDGPLPDVITDAVAAADAMRALVPGVTVALMLASTLHAIATGNLLPAGVETYCVDINQAVVTKLADRGSHQALGIVTDVGLFLEMLAARLCA